MPFTEKEIIDQLNEAAADYTFPMLDNGYAHHGDQKLTLFRDEDRWAMLIEVIGWSNRMPDLGGLATIAYTFGNCIGGDARYDNGNFFFFASDNGEPVFAENTGEGLVNPLAHSMRVKENVIPLRHDAAYYYTRSIELEEDERISCLALLRVLTPDYSHLFWVNREDIAHKIPADLPEILTITSWNHPDLADGETPGNNETFTQLAKVLVTGEVWHYKPAQLTNTHWRHWPDAGTL